MWSRPKSKESRLEEEATGREEPDEKEETEDKKELVEIQRHAVPAKSEAKAPAERTDDPARMYLREMASPREERIVRMRFGLGMNSEHTLEEAGQQFSVTRERIRQIEAKAIRKLKHPSRSRVLRSFLDN